MKVRETFSSDHLTTWAVGEGRQAGLFAWYGPGPLVDLTPAGITPGRGFGGAVVVPGRVYWTRQTAGNALIRSVRSWGTRSLESRPAELQRRMGRAA